MNRGSCGPVLTVIDAAVIAIVFAQIDGHWFEEFLLLMLPEETAAFEQCLIGLATVRLIVYG